MSDEPSDRGRIKSSETTFGIVEALHELERARLTELADRVGVANSTAHGHLATLRDRGYVIKDGDHYRLGLKFLDHGTKAKRHYRDLVDTATPVLEQLTEETAETVNLVVEEHGRAVYIARLTGERGVPTDAWVGRRKPIHTISAGKAILAHLPDERVDWLAEKHGTGRVTDRTIVERDRLDEERATIRDRGVAFNDRESHERIRAVGVPIVLDDRVRGAISVAGPAKRLTGETFENELPSLILGAVNEIELKLAYE